MKRNVMTIIIFACCVMTLAAQDVIRVNYQGAKPTISDFTSALLQYLIDDDECVNESARAFMNAWTRHRNGQPQDEGDQLTVDEKNGYVCFESRYNDMENEELLRIEMCYWNEADKKHKLVAYSCWCYKNGVPLAGQYDDVMFYRYDNATKKMKYENVEGFERQSMTDDGSPQTYALPRTGKNITVISWYPTGKRERQLKWNGRRFTKK